MTMQVQIRSVFPPSQNPAETRTVIFSSGAAAAGGAVSRAPIRIELAEGGSPDQAIVPWEIVLGGQVRGTDFIVYDAATGGNVILHDHWIFEIGDLESTVYVESLRTAGTGSITFQEPDPSNLPIGWLWGVPNSMSVLLLDIDGVFFVNFQTDSTIDLQEDDIPREVVVILSKPAPVGGLTVDYLDTPVVGPPTPVRDTDYSLTPETPDTLTFLEGDVEPTPPFFITGIADNTTEGQEQVDLVLTNPSVGLDLGSLTSHLVTIRDSSLNPVVVDVGFFNAHLDLQEPPPGQDLVFPIELTVTPIPDQDITVTLTNNGNPSQFSYQNPSIIPQGFNGEVFTVVARLNNTNLSPGVQTFIFFLTDPNVTPGNAGPITQMTVDVTAHATPTLPTVFINPGTVTRLESAQTYTVQVTVASGGTHTSTIIVPFEDRPGVGTTPPTGFNPDYQILTQSPLQFPPGVVTQDIEYRVLLDQDHPETPNETFAIRLVEPVVGAVLPPGGPVTHQQLVTIQSVPPVPPESVVSWQSTAQANFLEADQSGNGYTDYPVQMRFSPVPTLAGTVQLGAVLVSGEAVRGVDFDLLDQQGVVAPANVTHTIDVGSPVHTTYVRVYDDQVQNTFPIERFSFHIVSAAGGIEVDPDNDQKVIGIQDAQAVFGVDGDLKGRWQERASLLAPAPLTPGIDPPLGAELSDLLVTYDAAGVGVVTLGPTHPSVIASQGATLGDVIPLDGRTSLSRAFNSLEEHYVQRQDPALVAGLIADNHRDEMAAHGRLFVIMISGRQTPDAGPGNLGEEATAINDNTNNPRSVRWDNVGTIRDIVVKGLNPGRIDGIKGYTHGNGQGGSKWDNIRFENLQVWGYTTINGSSRVIGSAGTWESVGTMKVYDCDVHPWHVPSNTPPLPLPGLPQGGPSSTEAGDDAARTLWGIQTNPCWAVDLRGCFFNEAREHFLYLQGTSGYVLIAGYTNADFGCRVGASQAGGTNAIQLSHRQFNPVGPANQSFPGQCANHTGGPIEILHTTIRQRGNFKKGGQDLSLEGFGESRCYITDVVIDGNWTPYADDETPPTQANLGPQTEGVRQAFGMQTPSIGCGVHPELWDPAWQDNNGQVGNQFGGRVIIIEDLVIDATFDNGFDPEFGNRIYTQFTKLGNLYEGLIMRSFQILFPDGGPGFAQFAFSHNGPIPEGTIDWSELKYPVGHAQAGEPYDVTNELTPLSQYPGWNQATFPNETFDKAHHHCHQAWHSSTVIIPISDTDLDVPYDGTQTPPLSC